MILGHACFSNQEKINGLHQKGQRRQVQTERMLGFCQGPLGLWALPDWEAPLCANHPQGSFSNIPFSIPPQGPESVVSCQEVKPASPESWGQRLALEEEEDRTAPGQTVVGRTLPGGLTTGVIGG